MGYRQGKASNQREIDEALNLAEATQANLQKLEGEHALVVERLQADADGQTRKRLP